MTLEAKSSAKVPSLNAIDFASLARHRDAHSAEACLLLAPKYPGSTKNDDAAAAKMANQQRISCWTVAQLADVIEHAERRHVSARDVLGICAAAFTPDDVAAAVSALLSDPEWDRRALYRALVSASIEPGDRFEQPLGHRGYRVEVVLPSLGAGDSDSDRVDVKTDALSAGQRALNKERPTADERVEHRVSSYGEALQQGRHHRRMKLRRKPEKVMRQAAGRRDRG
jgi:hypothetical protein